MRSISVGLLLVACGEAGAATLPPTGSGKIVLPFQISDYFQNYAAQGGNPRPSAGYLHVALPANFNAQRSWPLLIVTSTTDKNRTSPMDLPFYARTANPAGWVVIATDATIRPKADSTTWRLAVLAAGLEKMQRDWPSSKNWPTVFAGLSGGAKRSCWLGAILAQTHLVHVRGFFLAGMNDDRMSDALRDYPATPGLLAAPIWMSCGRHDPIAPPEFQREAQASLKHLGFKEVTLSQFDGGHEVDRADLARALRWFREKGQF